MEVVNKFLRKKLKEKHGNEWDFGELMEDYAFCVDYFFYKIRNGEALTEEEAEDFRKNLIHFSKIAGIEFEDDEPLTEVLKKLSELAVVEMV